MNKKHEDKLLLAEQEAEKKARKFVQTTKDDSPSVEQSDYSGPHRQDNISLNLR